MTKISALVLGALAIASAQASCPEIDGRYRYTCRLASDGQGEFGSILDVAGHMIVEQAGCGFYRFTETVRLDQAEIDLMEREDAETKIKKSTEKKLRFKTVERPEHDFIINTILGERYITRAKIRKTSDGFRLKGKEKSRFMGILVDRHSKFDCRFDRI